MRTHVRTLLVLALAAAGWAAVIGSPAASASRSVAALTVKVPPSCLLLPLSTIRADLGGRPSGPTYVNGVCLYGTLDLRYGALTYTAMLRSAKTDDAHSVSGEGVDAGGFTEQDEQYLEMWHGGVTALFSERTARPAQLDQLGKTFAKLLWF